MPLLLRPKLTRIHDGAASFAKHDTPEENGSRDDSDGKFEKIIRCSIGQVQQVAGGFEIEIGCVALAGIAIGLHPGFADTAHLINENLRDAETVPWNYRVRGPA